MEETTTKCARVRPSTIDRKNYHFGWLFTPVQSLYAVTQFKYFHQAVGDISGKSSAKPDVIPLKRVGPPQPCVCLAIGPCETLKVDDSKSTSTVKSCATDAEVGRAIRGDDGLGDLIKRADIPTVSTMEGYVPSRYVGKVR